jgi:hypothetical protein
MTIKSENKAIKYLLCAARLGTTVMLQYNIIETILKFKYICSQIKPLHKTN